MLEATVTTTTYSSIHLDNKKVFVSKRTKRRRSRWTISTHEKSIYIDGYIYITIYISDTCTYTEKNLMY